ncbi:MAG: hypothetical protein IKY78_09425 [Clostridia bacterium]|nr:hypothetical protein [Clostridia bacterium]
MKKLIAATLAAILLFTLAACGKDNTDADSTEDSTAPVDGMEVVIGYDEDGKAVTEIVPTTKYQGTTDPMTELTVVIPYNYIYSLDEKYQQDIQLFATDNGFISCTPDEANGKITFVMTAAAHNTFLSEKRWELSQIFLSLINTYPFFDQCIANNIEYTDMTIRVDRKAYENDDSAAMIIDYVGSLCMNSYQIFLTTTNYYCNIKIVDKDTGEVIKELSKTSVFSN